MTDNVVMEELSKSYVESLANERGYFNSTSRDYGQDLTIRKANLCPTRNRYLTSGKAIDIQLKAVSERFVRGIHDDEKTTIKYDLEVKNYNDLIDRNNQNGKLIPLILIVFVIPDNRNEWLSLDNNKLILKKCAYWYEVPEGSIHSSNSVSITIEIPKTNILTPDFFDEQFRRLD